MSLINEALKKAQKMRQPDAPAEPTGAVPPAASAPRVAKRRPAVQARNVVIAAGCVVAVFAVALASAFLFLLPDTSPPEIIARPKAARGGPAPASVPPAETIPTVTAPAFLTSPAPAAEPPPGAARAAESGPAATVAADEAPVQPAGGPAEAPVQPAPPVTPPAPVENPQVYDFLDTLRVAGIRASATDPKVLMNDRVFRRNDIVDRTLGLRIIGIEPGGLTFQDESGFEYRKNF